MSNKTRQGISPVAAAVTGAVIGAGAAVAGVAALRDKKNRAKAKEVITQVKAQAKGYIKKLEDKAQEARKEAEGHVAKGKSEVKKITNTATKKAKN